MSTKLGLTGSIGMGKSTTAGFFAEKGVPVWDADAAVHEIYEKEGVAAIADILPNAIVDGKVDRGVLKAEIAREPGFLSRIEDAIHPLVGQHRATFLAKHLDKNLVVMDIPLLFETGADEWLDAILVVTAPAEVQKSRVMARTGMTEPHFKAILARQTPDSVKREKADFIIDTSKGIEAARQQVHNLIKKMWSKIDA